MTRATSRRNALALWAGVALSLGLLLAWTRSLWVGYLVLAVAASVGVVALLQEERRSLPPPARRWAYAGMAALAVGLLVAGAAHWRFQRIEFGWEALSAAREEQLAKRLSRRMEELERRGQAAARLGAEALGDTLRRHAFDQLSQVREDTRVDALLLLDSNGNPMAWSGEHRGQLPETLRADPVSRYFEERPLFSYLYHVQPLPDGAGRVVSAVLIETGPGAGETRHLKDLATGALPPRVSFLSGSTQSAGRTVWALVEGADTVVQAKLRPITQRELRSGVERLPRRVGVLFAGVAFALFSVAYLRARRRARAPAYAPLLVLLPLLALAPFGSLGVENIFSPAFFLLHSGDLTLGRVLVLLVPLAAFASTIRQAAVEEHRLPLVVGIGAVAVALAFPGGLRLMISAATRPLLESATPLWIGLQLASVLLLATVTGLAMPRARARQGDGPGRTVLAITGGVGVALAALLGVGVASRTGPVTTTLAALWAAPFTLVALAAAWEGGRRGAVRRWLLAGWLAVTAVLPHLWGAHVQARLATAEAELSTLGSQSDPYLEYLLRSFGQQALARFETGETGVQLLYRTYVSSGLVREGYQARLTLWSPDNLPTAQLGSIAELTVEEWRVLRELLDEARVEGFAAPYTFADQPNMSRVLALPLPDGDVITVVVPPRRTLGQGGAFAFLLGAEQSGSVRLNLVRSQSTATVSDSVSWYRSRGGWRTRAEVRYPDGPYHAHLLVPLPATGVWLVRAALLVTLDAAVLLLIWALGVLARGSSPVPRGSWQSWVRSFRARITLALLAFFLLPTVVFGYAAYQALAREVERATQTVASRAAAQAVSEFHTRLGDLRVLAQHAGTDVLYYSGGELTSVSAPEALELGLYNAWMPPVAYGQLENGEESVVQDVQSFGDQRYVIAFHALVPSGALAVPMPLATADIAIRQRELAHLIGFAAVVGALLSLALSVAVGRALAGPIGLLRRASAAVGSGRLRVRLPEDQRGEFGQVFTSFNRMVRRLRRARARELQSARVLAWGEMARQVAHEIKNPLTPIKLSVQHLRRAHHDGHPEFGRILEGSVFEILREIDRLSEIARAFSRYGAPAFASGPLEAVDVAVVVREALTLYRHGDEGVRYHEVVDAGVPPVQARTGELKEVLLNLIENARAALDGSGEIVVRALAQDEVIELEVEDDGAGIAPELLERVFDPHFSTRTTGTGLGLAIVRRLVEGWGGSVSVDSRAGEGTRVSVRLLPAAGGAPEAQGTR